MRLNLLFKASAILLAGIMMASSTASAVTSYTSGDVLLGFHATGGTGNTSEVVINLGNYSQFVGVPVNTNFDLPLTSVSTDLSVYGLPAAWSVRSDLYWGAMGTDENSFDLFATRGRSIAATPATPYLNQDFGNTQAATGTINTAGGFFNNKPAGSSNSVTTETAGAGSWTTQAPTIGGFLGLPGIDRNFNGTSVLDLFRLDGLEGGTPGPGAPYGTSTYLGSFTINSDTGIINFSNIGAVPEPSRALLLGFGLAAAFLRRRKA